MGTTALIVIMSARYLTSDPTQSLALTRDGRPYMDFAAAPSLFLEEDIRQENLLLVHRQKVCEDLKTSEINEAQAVAARSEAERYAEAKIAEERSAAARAAEAREIEVRASSSALPSRLPTPMPRCRLVPPSPAPRSSVRCSSPPAPSRSVPLASVPPPPLLPRMPLPRPVVPRPPLSRLVVPRTVPTPSA